MLLLLMALPATVLAQDTTRPDSLDILRAVRAEQSRFERRRRQYFPSYYGGPSEPCREVIGRLCYWSDGRDDGGPPPLEDPDVAAIRAQLIGALDRAAQRLPGDRWIAGQRVRYLVEAKRPAEAEVAAGACQADDGWCAALAGYALHAAGDFAHADAAFDRALGAMPEQERCRWTDLSLLLEGAAHRAYTRLPCEARDSLERRFWWLADPLFLTPGNERRTEHFARHVMDRLQDDAASPFTMAWAADLREVLIRYGWPAWWELRRGSGYYLGEASQSVVAHHGGPSRAFEPPSSWHQGALPTRNAWDLRRDRARGAYAPAYADHFDSLPHQVAWFRRGDSVVIVAAYDISGDSLDPTAPARALLTVRRGPGEPGYAVTAESGRARDVLVLRMPRAEGLLSLEVLAEGVRYAGRARYGVAPPPPPPAGLELSDLLMLTRPDSLLRTLDAAIPLARPTARLEPDETVGLYWEVYGLGPRPAPFGVSLTVVKEGGGLLKRVGRALGLGSDRPQVSLGWDDVSRPGRTVTPGALSVDLTGNGPGRYTIRLAVKPAAGPAAVAERQVTIVERRDR